MKIPLARLLRRSRRRGWRVVTWMVEACFFFFILCVGCISFTRISVDKRILILASE